MVQSNSSRLGSGASAMRVPGLARKFWTMISWMCPWDVVSVAEREQRLDPLFSRFADADEDAGGEGHRLLAREAQRLQPYHRALVG